jgi:putative FmdB family regulatory protein
MEAGMPFYDFRCACGNEFNVMARLRELEERTIMCPECGSNSLSRIYGNINVIASSGKSGNSGRSGKRDAPACPNEHICGDRCRH